METIQTTAANGLVGTTATNEKKPILVIGGTGKTGSRVVNRLNALGWPVTIGSRSSTPKFDWHDTRTWEQALQGADSVYISYQPDVAIPGSTDAISYLIEIAAKAGVRKLVLLSGRGELEAQECEKIVMQSDLEWTIVRASWFNQNFSEGIFAENILAGYMALPAGNVGEPFVDTDDIADVAVAALTQDGHNNKVYEVTGPRLLTFKEAVEEIAKVTGKPIHYEQIPMDAYAAELAEYQLPPDIIWLITYLFTEVLDGRNENITHGVEEALGRKATDFTEYVKKAAAEGAWG
jgi:uncharacterized protein YbjT (DUF2867 family)